MKAAQPALRVAALAAVAFVAAAAGAAGIANSARPQARFPMAAQILWPKLAARSAPTASARIVKMLPQFRTDFRATVVLAVGQTRDRNGARWIRVSLPMRPNGRFGWVRAVAVHLRPVRRRIIVDRSARTLTVLDRRTRVFRTRVAIGRPQTPTPLGRFYITATYRATERWLGARAFETSAYSSLSEWPGGGVVGIHGTPWPQLLGRAVSHGCIRISNAAAIRLKRLAAPGTPVLIRR